MYDDLGTPQKNCLNCRFVRPKADDSGEHRCIRLHLTVTETMRCSRWASPLKSTPTSPSTTTPKE